MKYFIIFFFSLGLINCSVKSQEASNKLIIDAKLSNALFNNTSYIQEGYNKSYIDSVLIDSSSVSETETFLNAKIRDLKGKHFPFDTCRSFYSSDTLMIEIRNTFITPSDRILIKLIRDDVSTYFITATGDRLFEAGTNRLVFKKAVKKKGDVIFGKLEVEFKNAKADSLFSYQGAFMCSIE